MVVVIQHKGTDDIENNANNNNKSGINGMIIGTNVHNNKPSTQVFTACVVSDNNAKTKERTTSSTNDCQFKFNPQSGSVIDNGSDNFDANDDAIEDAVGDLFSN